MRKQDFYRKLTEAVSNGIMKAIDGDEMFDNDETELNPMEDDVEDSSVYTNHSKLYTDLQVKGRECLDRGIELSLIDNNGNQIKTIDNASDIRFIKFSTEKMKRGERGIDNSIVISTHWKEHFDRINWLESEYEDGGQKWQDERVTLTQGITNSKDANKDFNGYLNTKRLKDIVAEQGKDYKTYITAVAKAYDTTEVLNGREIHGYLPAMGQLRFMCDNIDLVNDVLKLLHVETIDLQSSYWWASTEYNGTFAWKLINGSTGTSYKTYNGYALPLFRI